MKHSWNESHDLIAYLMYRNGTSEKFIEVASTVIGTTVDSLKMRIKNFEYLDKGTGLDHVAAQSKNVYNKFKGLWFLVIKEFPGQFLQLFPK